MTTENRKSELEDLMAKLWVDLKILKDGNLSNKEELMRTIRIQIVDTSIELSDLPPTHYKIVYSHKGNILTTENRTHTTGVAPSEKMIINCMHSLCLNAGIKDFTGAKAVVYKDEVLYETYINFKKI